MSQAIPIHLDRFPDAYAYLQATLPTVSGKSVIWAPFLANSKLSQAEAIEATKWGTPPWVFASPLTASQWALFNPANPTRIELSTDVLSHFAAESSKPTAQEFLLAKVLHELCHWSCARKGVQEVGEVGEAFERAAFGSYLFPWWAGAPTPLAPAETLLNATSIDESVFRNPKVRAAACSQLLSGNAHVPGRMKDPSHACFGGEDVSEPQARGVRNNNPGNIRNNGIAWQGLARPDQMTDFQQRETAFFVFREPEWGIRAMISLLRTYKHKHGLVTPRGIISRYAPASDNNNVASYASALASGLQIGIDDPTNADDGETVLRMVLAMVWHENGTKALFSDTQYRAGLELV